MNLNELPYGTRINPIILEELPFGYDNRLNIVILLEPPHIHYLSVQLDGQTRYLKYHCSILEQKVNDTN